MRRRPTPRQRLTEDARRTVGWMAAVLADAERVQAEIPDGVTASVTVWRAWADRLQEWAEGEETP